MNNKIIFFIITSILLTIPPLIENVDGFKNRGSQIVVNLQPGESHTGLWELFSEQDKTVNIIMSVEGEGAELVTIPDKIIAEPNTWYPVVITITIPEDYPNDVFLEPIVYGLIKGEQKEGAVNINLRMKHPLSITIGNPVIEEKVAEEKSVETMEETLVKETQDEKPKEDATPFELNAPTEQEEGGGCLISTATFGSELAPQVQMLREIRDNTLLSTESGSTFMTGFNTLYYSFSPTVADWERESPIFREAVKITLTPLITSLSVLNYVDMDSEAEVLGYGISLILLNIGMYFVAPAILITRLCRKKI